MVEADRVPGRCRLTSAEGGRTLQAKGIHKDVE